MEHSPFPFQGPLPPDAVHGRDDLVADLVERITAGRVTALLGPRRFGKTSVLGRVAAEVGAAGVSTIVVDLYEVASAADLAVRFDEAVASARGQVVERIRHLLGGAEINLGVVKLAFTRRPAERPDPVAVLHQLLDAVVAAAERDPVLLILDEFAGIDRVDGAAGLLRTKLQHHVRDMGIVFAGSQPALMRSLFTDVARPFYGQAELVEIGPLTPAALTSIVRDGFRSTGRDAGRLGAVLHEFAGGHPQRSMQLADAVWRRAVAGERFRDEWWGAALDDVRGQSDLANEALFSRSISNDQKVLRLVANGAPLFGSAATVVGLSPGSGQSSRNRLVDNGEIMRGGSRWRLVDPIYADWIRRRFPI
jgi:uncharacterized protein